MTNFFKAMGVKTDDLKNLLLITYNECLNEECTSTPIIKEYLNMVIKHFINLENEASLLEESK